MLLGMHACVMLQALIRRPYGIDGGAASTCHGMRRSSDDRDAYHVDAARTVRMEVLAKVVFFLAACFFLAVFLRLARSSLTSMQCLFIV